MTAAHAHPTKQSSRADRTRYCNWRNYFYDCQAVRTAAEVLPEFNVPRVFVTIRMPACLPAYSVSLVRSVAEFNTVTCV